MHVARRLIPVDSTTKAKAPPLTKQVAPPISLPAPPDPSVAQQLSALNAKFDQFLTMQMDQIKRQSVKAPKETPTTSALTIARKAAPRGHKGKYYAVARGRSTGIFTTWAETERLVKGFSDAKHCSFKRRSDAEAWLDNEREISESGSESSDDRGIPKQATRAASKPRAVTEDILPPTSFNIYESIMDPATSGRDPSVGKSKEIYDTSIEVEAKVIKLLCPKGVTPDVQRELLETAADVVSLPGKFSAQDSSTVIDQLGAMVGDLATQQAIKNETQTRDANWKHAGRNMLDKIKNLEDLIECAEDVASQQDRVITNMRMNVVDVLYRAGWEHDHALLYFEAGMLPRIVKSTLQYYYQLLLHLRTISTKDPNAWESTGSVHLLHHATQLRHIRMFSTRRIQMITQNYTYLRDAAAKGFVDLRLVGKITQKLQELLYTNLDTSKIKGKTLFDCVHCHQNDSFHEGGQDNCPLHSIRAKRARVLAKDVARKIRANPELSRDELIQKAIAKEAAAAADR
jgi:hypothetical protein